jgi:hypothetical protein
MTMTDFLICPICKHKAKPIGNTVGTIGFECPKHDKFRVTNPIKATSAHWNASEERWENALHRARSRYPDAWAAIIKDEDFDEAGRIEN